MVTRLERDRLHAPPRIWQLLFGGFALIGLFFLIEEHRAHVLGALPYILGMGALLFCIFGHRHAGTRGTHDDKHGGTR